MEDYKLEPISGYEFPLDGSGIVEEARKQNNYKIIDTRNRTGRAIVFFSGNGLFYPNTPEEFEKTILVNNRYEWENVAKNRKIRKYYEKIIFVRDIYKQYYVRGISEKCSTIDSLAELVKELTGDFETVCCGNSAGGYIAMRVGAIISAKRVISFSGFFELNDRILWRTTFLRDDRYDVGKSVHYASETAYLDRYNSFGSNIYHFYPALNENDVEQVKINPYTSVHILALNESIHGRTVDGMCYPYILTMSDSELITLFDKYKGKIVDARDIKKSMIPMLNCVLHDFVWFVIKRIQGVKSEK